MKIGLDDLGLLTGEIKNLGFSSLIKIIDRQLAVWYSISLCFHRERIKKTLDSRIV